MLIDRKIEKDCRKCPDTMSSSLHEKQSFIFFCEISRFSLFKNLSY